MRPREAFCLRCDCKIISPNAEPSQSDVCRDCAYIAPTTRQHAPQPSGVSQFDDVANPSHYVEGRAIEPIDAIEDWQLGYHLGQVVKYVSRAGRKQTGGRMHDLKKAAWYLAREIARSERP